MYRNCYRLVRLGKKSNLKLVLTLLFSFLLFSENSPAQTGYLISLANGEKVNQNIFEFDVLINSTDEDFELTSYQAALSFSDLTGSVSFSFIENTSELSNKPSIGIGVNSDDGNTELTFASLPGNDIISDQVVRIGRFRIECSEPFESDPSIRWNFTGKITTILTGSEFENITNPSSHVSEFSQLQKLSVNEVTASATTDLNTAPEKTVDGLGYYDNDPNSRWAARPLPQWISYDLGMEQVISIVKTSFFNFQLNRIYQYSVSVSSDNTNWITVADNVSSLPEEWSVAEFSPVSARYVKIDIHSSTNNPDSWANIWETEIYGNSQTTSVDENNHVASPADYELFQNYPNPFNPSTKITFNLLQDAETELTVYNIMGEKVAELVNDFLTAGKHEIIFNGEGLASGIYIYKLNVKDKFVQIKKMILVK